MKEKEHGWPMFSQCTDSMSVPGLQAAGQGQIVSPTRPTMFTKAALCSTQHLVT